jgi:hypothetical protein
MGSITHVETSFRRLQWLIAARNVEITFAKFVALWRKAGFNPDQPRDEFGDGRMLEEAPMSQMPKKSRRPK